MMDPEKEQTSQYLTETEQCKRSDGRKQRRQTVDDQSRFTNLSFQSTYVCMSTLR